MSNFKNVSRWKSLSTHPLAIVLLFNLLLALTAFGKDVLLAQYLGTSEVADAFTLAYFIPDTIGNNLIATTLSVVCIPIFTRLVTNGKKEMLGVVTMKLMSVTTSFTFLLMIVLWVMGKPIIQFFGHGLSPKALELTYQYFELMLPIVVLHSIILIGAAYHQSKQNFLVPAAGPVLFNGLIFISLLICLISELDLSQGGYVLSFTITLATIFYLLLTWIPMKLKTQVPARQNARTTLYIKAVGHYFISYFMILLFSQSLLFVERSLASQLEEGTIAGLSYAYRLAQLPIWVFVSGVTTVILPFLSREMSQKRLENVSKQMYRALGIVLFVSVSSSLFLFFLREPIITLLFKRGAFTDQSVQITSTILAGYSLSIAGQSISLVCIRYYVAKRVMKIPVIILFLSTLGSISFDLVYVPKWGASALGYGAMVGSIISCCLFLLAIFKEWNLIRGSRMRYENH